MIQRIQSLWLLLAAMINGALFISPLYKYEVSAAGIPVSSELLSASKFYPLMIMAAVITLLPLIIIFLYSDRKKQKRMIWAALLGNISFISVMLMRIAFLKNNTPGLVNDQYLVPGSLLPAIGMIFLVLALSGIIKDDKLVRSMDRLR